MIVVADTDLTKWAMFNFLRERGVRLSRSEDFQAIGRLSDNSKELIGVVAYNGFCGRVCSMHIAGDGNWISREFIRTAFRYPFVQLELEAVIAPVPSNNSRALKLDTHFGFREVHRVQDGWERGIDIVFLELKACDCRYLGKGERSAIAEVA